MPHLGLFSALPSPLALPVLVAVTWLAGRPFTAAIRDALPASRAERALLDVVAGAVVVSWLGTVLAVLALFRWWWFAAAWSGAALVAALVARRRPPGEVAPPPARGRAEAFADVLACAALLGFAAWLAAGPSETFVLQDDASVYTMGGIHLAESGWLFADTPAPAGGYALVQRGLYNLGLLGELTPHYGPFFPWLAGIDAVEIGFLPLAKVWTAWAAWWLGPARAVWATPLAAWIAVAVMLAWWRRALGRAAAALAVLALVVSFPQIWFARYPLAEIPAQALIASAAWLARWARQLGDEGRGGAATGDPAPRWLAAASAASLAALTMLRLEGLALGALLGAALTLGWWRERARAPLVAAWWAVWTPLAAVGALAVAIANRQYVHSQSVIAAPPSLARGLMAAGLAGVAAAWWIARTAVRDRERLARRAGAAARVLPAAMGVAWLAWPALAALDWMRHPFAFSQAQAIALYWLPSGLALSVAGLVWLAWRDRRGAEPELAALALVAAAFVLFTVWKPYISAAQPWAMRRMIPLVMPALALGLAVPAAVTIASAARALRAAREAGGGARRARWRSAALCGAAALAVAAGAAQLGAVGRLGTFVWLHRDWAGVFDQLAGAAALFPRGALVFVEAGPVGARLTAPLDLVFGVDARPLPVDPRNTLAWVALDEVLDDAARRDRPLFFAATGEGSTWATERWELRPFRTAELTAPVLSQRAGARPDARSISERRIWLDLYRVVPTSAAARAARLTRLPVEVPLGAGSYPFLERGWLPFEHRADGVVARWTTGAGHVAVPWPSVASGAGASPEATREPERALCLALDWSGYRASGNPPDVAVEVEGRVVFEGTTPPGAEVHHLRLPVRDLADDGDGRLELALRSSLWSPAGVSGGEDRRLLGLLVSRVAFLPAPDCAESASMW